MKYQKFLDIKSVQIQDEFWSPLQSLVMETVIPYQYGILNDQIDGAEKSHALDNFRIAAGKEEGEFYGMVFQDSDVAKWLEAVAYALALRPDAELEKKADEIIDLVGQAQEENGYLNTYFSIKEPDKKWQNLQECHELYCNGHMIEAAVAFHEALGKDSLLKIMCKTADLICDRFGKGKVRGYPGHPEIEMALLRLYRATGERKYREEALYFLNERGTEPEYFAEEAKTRKLELGLMDPKDRNLTQTYAPVREQEKAVGHAVRAVYLYTAMADMASEIDDPALTEACRRLWKNITRQKMYITGSIGATVHGEAFSVDYELPNDLIYAETCASVAMAFFARRMLELEVKGEYADILEKELYNGILSGMQNDGKNFFYVNPLEVVPGVSGVLPEYKHVLPRRPGWYQCACCPPNVARLITSFGEYVWGEKDDTIYAHTYVGGRANFKKQGISVLCESNYPWQGEIRYTVEIPKKYQSFTFAVHIPGWCQGWNILLNDKEADYFYQDGYIYLQREWKNGDTLKLTLPMMPRRVYSNPLVRADAGCTALMRGPVVYCFEETDNGKNLAALRLPKDETISVDTMCFLGKKNIPLLKMNGNRVMEEEGQLYSDKPFPQKETALCAVPYFMWGNREAGGMRVWMVEG